MVRRTSWLLVPGLVFLVIAFALPAVLMLVAPPDATVVDIWGRLVMTFTEPYDLRIVARTVVFALVVTAACLLFGFPIAYLLVRSTSRFAGLWLALAIFPLLLSTVVRTFGWLVILGSNGAIGRLIVALGLADRGPQLLYTPLAVILGLVQLFTPLAVITLYSTIAQIDRSLEDAARGLGASPARSLWSVTIPLTMPGLVVAATLVFAGSVTAYTTPYLLGGANQRMLATQLFTYANVTVNWAAASATAIVMTIIVLLVSGISNAYSARKARLA